MKIKKFKKFTPLILLIFFKIYVRFTFHVFITFHSWLTSRALFATVGFQSILNDINTTGYDLKST